MTNEQLLSGALGALLPGAGAKTGAEWASPGAADS